MADESTDAETALADLRDRLERSLVQPERRALVLAEARAVLTEFVANGRKLSALGSQFSATREIKGVEYTVAVAYAPRSSKSWFARLLGR